MLARDYTNVGSKGFILEAWTTEEIVGDIGSIGSAQDGAITISDKSGTVQVMVPSYVPSFRNSCRIYMEPSSSVVSEVRRTHGWGVELCPQVSGVHAEPRVVACASFTYC